MRSETHRERSWGMLFCPWRFSMSSRRSLASDAPSDDAASARKVSGVKNMVFCYETVSVITVVQWQNQSFEKSMYKTTDHWEKKSNDRAATALIIIHQLLAWHRVSNKARQKRHADVDAWLILWLINASPCRGSIFSAVESPIRPVAVKPLCRDFATAVTMLRQMDRVNV